MELSAATNLLPMSSNSGNSGAGSSNIYSRLLKDRIIYLGAAIDDAFATANIAKPLFLEHESPDQVTRFFINSPGGEVYSGLAIYDAMMMIKPNVATLCTGMGMAPAKLLHLHRKWLCCDFQRAKAV